ncbi:MAG: 4Fe-4S cluster-binding domain-containing protein [Candidatus Omnitrophica bacterium]|nr:4Fe-4S cluster-binding domain-containing protein [Candidatus Omnitrophota bacterium]
MLKSSYLELYQTNSQAFQAKVEKAYKTLESCTLCPHNCKVNRLEGQIGTCKTGAKAEVYSFMAHHGEEPPISGSRGSGTIFFSNCNLHCCYCQNYEFSQMGGGREVEPEELAKIMLELQTRGCHNINFVSPTHVASQILQGIWRAIPMGLEIPLVYNTGGYDNVEILKLFDGIIDIYLPDMRYNDAEIALKLSGAKEYPKYNRLAIKEMWRQVPKAEFDQNKVILRGMIIRHLVLPNGLSGTSGIMKFLANEVSKEVHVALMSQYFPCFKASKEPKLARRITLQEYESAKGEMSKNGLKNGWFQDEHGLDRFQGINIKPNITP